LLKELLFLLNHEHRRWFRDDYFDFIVWIGQDAAITGIQLCYDKEGHERAITWRQNTGFSHERVDTGETNPEKNRSPMLVPDDVCPVHAVLEQFTNRSNGITQRVRSFVLARLQKYAAGLKGDGD
jgi:hypothetical protein